MDTARAKRFEPWLRQGEIMKILKNQKGFSLLEIMVASLLASFVIGALFASVRAYDANGDLFYTKTSMEEQGMRALQKMELELRETAPSRISLGSGGSSITFSVPSESSPTTAGTYAVDWTNAHSITYSVSGTQLIRTDANAVTDTTTRKLSNFVSSVVFAVPSSGVVTITLNLSQTLKNTRTLTKTLTATAQLRNP